MEPAMTICFVVCLLGKYCPPQSHNDSCLSEMQTPVSQSPATVCPRPDWWRYPHVPLHLAGSQVRSLTDLSHGRVSLCGIYIPRNNTLLRYLTEQQSMHLSLISWVLVAEGEEVAGSCRQSITSPKYRWNKSPPVPLGSHGAAAPARAAYTVSSGAPKASAKMVLSSLLSQHPVSTQQGQQGMGRFLPLSPSINMCRVTSHTFVLKRNI